MDNKEWYEVGFDKLEIREWQELGFTNAYVAKDLSDVFTTIEVSKLLENKPANFVRRLDSYEESTWPFIDIGIQKKQAGYLK